MKCIHPRKVNKTMAQFINSACDLTYTAYRAPEGWQAKDITIENILKYLDVIEEVEVNVTCNIKNSTHFATQCNEEMLNDDGTFTIFVNKLDIDNYLYQHNKSTGGQYILQDFRKRNSITKGFATITLILLHELGHQETFQQFTQEERIQHTLQEDAKCYEVEQQYKNHQISKKERSILRNIHHVDNPEEQAATNWAIEWLKDAEHRKLAKQFEKKFFACFAK